jgi:hypothetical protein
MCVSRRVPSSRPATKQAVVTTVDHPLPPPTATIPPAQSKASSPVQLLRPPKRDVPRPASCNPLLVYCKTKPQHRTVPFTNPDIIYPSWVITPKLFVPFVCCMCRCDIRSPTTPSYINYEHYITYRVFRGARVHCNTSDHNTWMD